jgi:PAS domain S-box-containing protein
MGGSVLSDIGKVLLLEDSASDARLLFEMLKDDQAAGLELVHVTTLAQAIERLKREEFEATLLDLAVPDSQGLQTLLAVQTSAPEVPIVVLTGLDEQEIGMEAIRLGAQDFLNKGQISRPLLVRALRYAVERKRIQVLLKRSNASLEQQVRERTADVGHAQTALGEEFDERTQVQEALARSELRFHQIAQALPDVFWMASADMGTFYFCSDAYEKVWGRPAQTLIRDAGSWLQAVHPDDQQRVQETVRIKIQLASEGKPYAEGCDFRVVRPDGSVVAVRARTVALRDPKGVLTGFVGVVEDVTQQAMNEQLLQRYAAIVESTSDAIVSVDGDLKIVTFNPGAERLYGYAAQDAMGKCFTMLLAPDRIQEAKDMLRMVEQGRAVGTLETVCVRKDGAEVNVQVTVSAIRDIGGKVTGFSGVLRDVTHQRSLERKVLEAGTAERRQIGQDLHDIVGQNLTAATFLAKALANRLASRESSEAADAQRIVEVINEAVAQTRAIIRGIRPIELQTDGMSHSLRELANDTQRVFGIQCRVEVHEDLTVQNKVVATQLYYIAREAVNNAVKHARATVIDVSLASCSDRIYMRIADNGVGMPAELPKSKGAGLEIMEYRARLIGASVQVRTGPSGGTEVICSVPVQNTLESAAA